MVKKLTIRLERLTNGNYTIWNRGICLTNPLGLCENMTKDMFNLKKHLIRGTGFYGTLSCKFTKDKK